ncbi:MAG TPA: hypothetical protein VFH61_06165 [Thermoleophilia bacterium]|nr:hypothetical protein [Thermoleophilia bacterium]
MRSEGLSTQPKTSSGLRLATVGVALAAVGLLAAPLLVVVGLFTRTYEMMSSVAESTSPAASLSLPALGSWALLPFVVTLPGLFVSLIAWQRAGSERPGRGLALVGVVLAALALLSAAGLSWSLYGGGF